MRPTLRIVADSNGETKTLVLSPGYNLVDKSKQGLILFLDEAYEVGEVSFFEGQEEIFSSKRPEDLSFFELDVLIAGLVEMTAVFLVSSEDARSKEKTVLDRLSSFRETSLSPEAKLEKALSVLEEEEAMYLSIDLSKKGNTENLSRIESAFAGHFELPLAFHQSRESPKASLREIKRHRRNLISNKPLGLRAIWKQGKTAFPFLSIFAFLGIYSLSFAGGLFAFGDAALGAVLLVLALFTFLMHGYVVTSSWGEDSSGRDKEPMAFVTVFIDIVSFALAVGFSYLLAAVFPSSPLSLAPSHLYLGVVYTFLLVSFPLLILSLRKKGTGR